MSVVLTESQQRISKESYRYNGTYSKLLNPHWFTLSPENFLPALEVNNDLQLFLGILLKKSIKEKYSLGKFERYCGSNGFYFSRRSLYGLIKGERGNFKLSWFACLFHLLGISLNDVLRAYVRHLDEVEGKVNPVVGAVVKTGIEG